MIPPKHFVELLNHNGVTFFTGVPDSVLKEFCFELSNLPTAAHVPAVNEGSAIALAAGHYLATGNPALVYLQNSGLGNAVNPLVSLADPAVYGIPMLLLIGWRGEPGVTDEPQHMRQGAITTQLLDTLGVPYRILSRNATIAQGDIKDMLSIARKERRPVALLVGKGVFSECTNALEREDTALVTREEALEQVVQFIGTGHTVATTGTLSRELFEIRERRKESHVRDFLTIGSMGHASSIALGIALARPEESIWCLDGDGALLMHLGSLAMVGKNAPENFSHIVFNNKVHDSVGGHPTAANTVDFSILAKAVGYPIALSAEDQKGIDEALATILNTKGPALLEIRVRRGSRKELGRPTSTPQESANAFRESFKF